MNANLIPFEISNNDTEVLIFAEGFHAREKLEGWMRDGLDGDLFVMSPEDRKLYVFKCWGMRGDSGYSMIRVPAKNALNDTVMMTIFKLLDIDWSVGEIEYLTVPIRKVGNS